jgi:hypothetical protein
MELTGGGDTCWLWEEVRRGARGQKIEAKVHLYLMLNTRGHLRIWPRPSSTGTHETWLQLFNDDLLPPPPPGRSNLYSASGNDFLAFLGDWENLGPGSYFTEASKQIWHRHFVDCKLRKNHAPTPSLRYTHVRCTVRTKIGIAKMAREKVNEIFISNL